MTLVVNDGAKFGFKNPNGTLTGSLRTLQTRKSDVAFIGFFIKDYQTRDIEFSAPIYSDELCIVVKKAERIPQYVLPLVIFDQTLWMFLGLETILGKSNLVLNRFKFQNLPLRNSIDSDSLLRVQEVKRVFMKIFLKVKTVKRKHIR